MKNYNNILIIDDDEVTNFLSKMQIESTCLSTASVKFCLTAEEGLKILELDDKMKTDLIFLDINLPFLNGWEFLDKLENDLSLKERNHPPIYMVSTSPYEEDQKKAKEHKLVKGYVKKPLLASKISELFCE